MWLLIIFVKKERITMNIITLEAGPLATRCYIVHADNSNKSIIIDAPLDSTDKFMYHIKKNNLDVKMILLTHSHWDHSADAPKLREITDAAIFVNKLDEYRLLEPNENSIVPLDFELTPFKPDFYLQDDMDIVYGDANSFEVVCTPGHTEGSVCFVERIEKVIFTGDTLFKNSIGRYDFPGGNYDDLMNSIKKKLLRYSDEFVIYPGHGMRTTIGEERKNNPFLDFSNEKVL